MDRREFGRRRRQLMRMIGREGIAVLPAAPVRLRNASLEYAYRQDSHFLYMTGFPEPEAVAVLVPGRPQGEYLLFVRERDAEMESMDGPRAGTEGAVARYEADDVASWCSMQLRTQIHCLKYVRHLVRVFLSVNFVLLRAELALLARVHTCLLS